MGRRGSPLTVVGRAGGHGACLGHGPRAPAMWPQFTELRIGIMFTAAAPTLESRCACGAGRSHILRLDVGADGAKSVHTGESRAERVPPVRRAACTQLHLRETQQSQRRGGRRDTFTGRPSRRQPWREAKASRGCGQCKEGLSKSGLMGPQAVSALTPRQPPGRP